MSKRIKKLAAITALALAGLSEPTFAQQVTIVDFGLYGATKVQVVTAPYSPTGQGRFIEPELIKQTDMVPATLNTKFGFRFKVEGLSEGSSARLRFKFTFPQMTNPSTGKVSSSFEAVGEVPVAPKVQGMFWDFVHPWEMRPGGWTMCIYNGDHLLAQKTFTVAEGKNNGIDRRESKPRKGEPDSPANRSQPVQLGTNSTPLPAGSGR
jgi:hypothetical protein